MNVVRCLLAAGALFLAVAAMGCGGEDGDVARTEASDEGNSQQARRESKDELKPGEKCAIAWNTTATEEHGTFGIYAESQAMVAEQAREIPGLAAEVPPRQQAFVLDWQFRDEEVAVIGPQQSVTLERGACVVSAQETAATPGMVYVQTDSRWFDAYPSAQSPNVYGTASPRLALYLDATIEGPSGWVLPDGRVDLLPGFDDGLGRDPTSAGLSPDYSENNTVPEGATGGELDSAEPSDSDWPQGTAAWTVVLASESTRDEADARRAQAESHEATGVLRSDDYSSLRGGYLVVFAGQYASGDEAQAAAERWQDQGFTDAYPRFVEP